MFNEEELKKIKELALENHVPIIMDDTLEVIEKILIEEKPKRILEIGTAVGYSAACFARMNEDTVIDTIELNEERYNEALINLEKIGIKDRVNVFLGNAVEILPTLNNEYDIVFIGD